MDTYPRGLPWPCCDRASCPSAQPQAGHWPQEAELLPEVPVSLAPVPGCGGVVSGLGSLKQGPLWSPEWGRRLRRPQIWCFPAAHGSPGPSSLHPSEVVTHPQDPTAGSVPVCWATVTMKGQRRLSVPVTVAAR